MNIFDEFPKLINHIERENLSYAIVGGVALAFHATPRFTQDIDILIFPEDIDRLKLMLSDEGFSESTRPWTFKNVNMTLHRFIKIDGEDIFQLDIITANEEKSRQIIKDALKAESEHGTIRVAAKKDLIWMKRQRNSDQDKVDIKSLKAAENEEN